MTGTGRPADRGPANDADGTVRTTHDWSEITPSTGVIETIAVAANCEPTAIEPLYETLDPDALDAVIQSGAGGTTVQFVFAGYDVTVHSNGAVAVTPL